MKTTLTILIVLCSIAAMGQIGTIGTLDTAYTNKWKFSDYGSSITLNPNQSDTVAVYMLVAKKVTHDYPLELRQIKGYSVTPRWGYNSIPIASYLDNNKKPMPDNYIVWMSVKR